MRKGVKDTNQLHLKNATFYLTLSRLTFENATYKWTNMSIY